MMRKFLLLALASILLQFTNAQKTIYDANAQVRTVGSFTGISVSGSVDLYISMGSEDVVAVSSDDAALAARITTEVKNGILYIGLDSKGINNWGSKSLKAYVSAKTMNKLQASGASDVHVDGALKGTDLSIELSGASDFTGAVDVQNLRLQSSGSSDCNISGKATNCRISVSGASDVKGYELVTDNCDAHASGSSDIKITVKNQLRGEASGASDINYKGNPTVKDVRSSGSGDIKQINN